MPPVTYLVLSIVALFVGVLAQPLVRSRSWLIAGLDGFVLASVGAFACVELIPHSLEAGGFWALAAIALGMVGPTWIERRSEGAHEHGSGGALVALVVGGLALHAAIDGSALALHHLSPDAQETEYLALAVLFHRLPVGFVIAWLAPAGWSMLRLVGLASVVSLTTLIGFALGQGLLQAVDGLTLALFEGVVAGTLLHVVLVHPPHAQGLGERPARLAGVTGVLAGLATVGAFLGDGGHGHSHGADHGEGVLETFYALAGESAPALVAAFIGAGLLRVFMGEGLLRWLGRGRAGLQALKGMVFGLPLPICSCGVVPLYEGMIRAGTPAAAALAFLVATPEIGLGAVLISVPLLGVEMTILRVLCAIVAAWVVAVVTVRFVADREPSASGAADIGIDLGADASLPERARAGLRYGLTDLVDDVMPWVVAGLGIAAILAPLLDASGLRELSPWLQVPLAGLMGLPVYVCASGSTPIVAVLLFSGLSPGAGIAFLLTGPATNIVTFGLLESLHSRRVALVFGVMMALMACGLGWLANVWSPALSGVAGQGLDHAHGLSTLQLTSLAALTGLMLWSLVRKGPRVLLAKVVPQHQHVHLDGEPCPDQPTASCHGDEAPAPPVDKTSCCD